MNLQFLCKAIQTRVTKEIAAARSQEEKALILNSALHEYGHSVLTALNALSPSTGASTHGYMEAQAAATELLIFLVLPFIGFCSTYKQGITVLEDLVGIVSDETIRRRIVIYIKQLKRRWHQTDPSVYPMNLRTARLRPREKQSVPFGSGVLIVLLFAVGLYFFARFDLTSLIFSGGSPPPPVQGYTQEEVVPRERQIAPVPPPSAGARQPSVVPTSEYFSYTDAKGVVHLGNNPDMAAPRTLPQLPQQTPRELTQDVPQQRPPLAAQQAAQREQAPVVAAPGFPPAAVIDKIQKYNSAGLNEFESCRCKNGIASKGENKQEVLAKCDQPAATTFTRTKNCTDLWLYNFGPNEFMQGVCFDRGRVSKVLSLDYGY
jgi:hypothetical protein